MKEGVFQLRSSMINKDAMATIYQVVEKVEIKTKV